MDSCSEMVAREILDIVPIIMRVIRAEMHNHRSADLAIPQFRTLLFIERNPGSSLLTLSKHLGLTPPTVSKMVDGLVLNRLVNRADSSKDRRMVTLTLTSQGQTILEKARNGTLTSLIDVLSRLTPEEGETVSQAMKLLHGLFLPGRELERTYMKDGQS